MHMPTASTVSVCLWYDGNTEAAARLYTSLIPNSAITSISPLMVTFTLDGMSFQALNGGPHFTPNEAASIVVSTKDQAETDRLWHALIADGGSASQCAWLKDRFGVSWQIVPQRLPELLSSPDRQAADRVFQAMLQMSKIEITVLEAAFNGA